MSCQVVSQHSMPAHPDCSSIDLAEHELMVIRRSQAMWCCAKASNFPRVRATLGQARRPMRIQVRTARDRQDAQFGGVVEICHCTTLDGTISTTFSRYEDVLLDL